MNAASAGDRTAGEPALALRFAPSPNGELHLGHALSALIGFDMARRLRARFLVRIEDIDQARCRPDYVSACLADLAWLGIAWDEPVIRQSDRFPVYAEAARRLEDMGLLYPCFATRAELAAGASTGAHGADPDGVPLYPGIFRGYPPGEAAARIARGEPYAQRLDMARALDRCRTILAGTPLTFDELDAGGHPETIAARPERWGDAVIVRKDTPASYHLAVVVDDAEQQISHVTRGRDLYAATDIHRLLQVLLGLPMPLYHHHRLVADETGRKLSKSAGDRALRALREAGVTPAEIRQRLRLPAAPAS
jgi:glutamyl-Q tRNA(Asp) synthetase